MDDTEPSGIQEFTPKAEVDLQSILERLLGETRKTHYGTSQPISTIHHPSLGEVEENAEVGLTGGSVLFMGLKWKLPEGKFIRYGISIDRDKKTQIWNAQPFVEYHGTSDKPFLEPQGHRALNQLQHTLSQRTDQSIVQAAANVLKEPVLHSVNLAGNKDDIVAQRSAWLIGIGYTKSPENPYLFTRTYQSEALLTSPQ